MSLYQDVIIAGFGGQGVLLIGNLLTYAAMDRGLNVTFMPVYGVEMRGGTANCTVVISDQEIGSPVIHSPKSLIMLNQPSVSKFQPRLQDQGIQVVNASLVDGSLLDADRIVTIPVPANELADVLGSVRMANMVALGAWVQAVGILKLAEVMSALHRVISSRNTNLIPVNEKALQSGADYAASLMARA